VSNEALLALAEMAGISPTWIDAFGAPQTVAPESIRAMLNALGMPSDTDADCEASIAALATEKATRPLPPLLTAQVGVAIPLGRHPVLRSKPYRVELEDGSVIEGRFSDDPEQALEITPLHRAGYHRLQVGDYQVTLAVAPARCYSVADAAATLPGTPVTEPRLWGIATQLYSLRRPGDGGIGDFGGLARFVRQAARRGAAAVAISPVHAMFADDLQRFSPYGPSSRVLFNALHIDPSAVMGEEVLAEVLREHNLVGEGERLEALELIDWPASSAWKFKVLRALYQRFRQAGGTTYAAFLAFREEQGDTVEDHARFEAMHAWLRSQGRNGDWRSWPEQYRDPRGEAIEQFAQEHADEVGFHAFLQWQAALGLQQAQIAAREAGMAIGLISDLAVGADPAGSQAWSRGDQMLGGLSVGAPPDVLAPLGQNWGLGAFSPVALRRHGFQAYLEMLRSAFRHAGGVRIDHVLGLTRMWLVPDGFSSTQGAYLRFPFDDLLRLIALESWRHRGIVIGEDLGTIPPGFGERLASAGILGIRVLWFQRRESRFLPPGAWSQEAMATTTTHDLPTIAGWWQARDIDWRARLDMLGPNASEAGEREIRNGERTALWQSMSEAGVLDAREGLQPPPLEHPPIEHAIAYVGMTPAPLAMIPIEDLLGLAEAPNLPGTIDQHPNWRRRMPGTVDSMLDDAAVIARTDILNQTRRSPEQQQ
jgi:4-alpha-glucanotransferase